MFRADAPRARTADLEVIGVSNETIVYDRRTDKAHCLNETAALVWKNCDGKNATRDIAKALQAELGANAPEDMVSLAIADLGKAGLLDAPGAKGFTAPRGVSRREVVRRAAGMATVALPLVSSLLAPTSASAASIACSCVVPGDCLSQTSCPSTVNCNGSGICAP